MNVVRVIATVLVLLGAVLPAAEHASASWIGGAPHAGVSHAPRTPPRGARATIVTSVVALPLAPLSGAPHVPTSTEAGLPSRPLAAPFVPPRG